MPPELYRRARRAEAGAERAEDRRRRRLDFFRGALAEGLEALKQRHAEGASGEDSVHTHARFMDDVVASLSHLASDDAEAAGLTPTPYVVVALGGYGRGELHPSSDIDLMIVYDGELSPYVQRVMQELLYTLWDLGLHVGHSLRSLEDCVAMARTDFPSRTSMQQARLVVGDKKLFTRFGRMLRDNVYRHDFEQFLATTLAEREQRYRKHGASPYIGEPNIKESAGGLRDMHTAMWLGAAKFGARTLRELAERGLITPHEQEAADRALTFLWRVRNELHFFSGHKNDVLSRELQPRIAKNLGYENEDDALGVERFMRDYYLNARAIHRVSQRLIARCHETLWVRGSAERRQRLQALADGLVFFDGRLHRADRDPGVLRRDPVRLMKVFWHLHRLGCDLSLGLERAVEESLDVVDDAFRRSPAVRDLFLDICRSWGRVGLTFSEMHELGLLGRYLPEFGGLTCLVQYDVYHKFSADQHSLLAVEHLEALAPGQSSESEGVAAVFNEVEKPELLMLGMLLHDIGKAKGHGHVAKGIPLIRELTTRMGLPPEDAGMVEFLVAHHLTMSHIAQDRYLATTSVQRMAAHLRLVARLESAPVATELFHHPDLGSSDLVVVTPDVPGLFALIAGTLAAHGVNIISAQIATRADGVAIDTFQVNDPTGEAVTSAAQWGRTLAALAAVLTHEQSVDGLLERRRAGGRATPPGEARPKIAVDNRLSDEYTVIEVKCPDRLGLLYLITRTLSALDLDIASARIATEIDQALDTFYVLDRKGRRLEDPDAIEHARAALAQALLQPL